MESLGIVRKIDETGRIVLPKDFRRRLALEPNADAVELLRTEIRSLSANMPRAVSSAARPTTRSSFPASESAKTALRDSAKSFDCRANNNTEKNPPNVFSADFCYSIFLQILYSFDGIFYILVADKLRCALINELRGLFFHRDPAEHGTPSSLAVSSMWLSPNTFICLPQSGQRT